MAHEGNASERDKKYIAQIKLILEGYGKDVEVSPAKWEETGAEYIYRTGVVLVRDEDVERVIRLFEGGRTGEGGIGGVTRLFLPAKVPPGAPEDRSTTQRFLKYADLRLGRGVVTPEHLFYVTPSVSPCPATEPEEVGPGTPPEPFLDNTKATGKGVKVVVLDVGWSDAPAAYWLDGVTGDPEDAFGPDGLIKPYAGHGTFIAGVLRSIARDVEVVVKSYFPIAGAIWEFDLAAALDEVLDLAPDIISLSAGTRTRFDLPPLGLDVFVQTRLNRVNGLTLVAAAGNESSRDYFWPAAFPEAVGVGALAENGRDRAWFSNFGGWVDVYAPGENLVNAFLTGEYRCTEPPHTGELRKFTGMARWSGTSYATPLVAGLIAGRMSLTGENALQSADALLAYALGQAAPGVGPVLRPGDAESSTT
ncbi:S8/S53 family peptidase [Kribbella sandramycini]|uniref:S8/S53 family peptidase n=1 Tax=Kribbella sandramycini TaxID=60450 RepID=A0A7Y4NYV7_9ACTN|nr:S8/S53 family peptidase [Kribbella sandramycini]MBB6569958.1 subtilisin family serine protease [Kribbella sandramycini]NOL40218.1 S8/S53 family peptidase [Kribbella sandramycini]